MASVWRHLPAGFLLAASGWAAAQESQPGTATQASYPEYAGEQLINGRSVWLGTCEGCHGYGIAGSPRIGDEAAWAPRIRQGMDVLYQHAIEGFFGPKSTHMPARGGNDDLSDEQVRAAVDYMVKASSMHVNAGANDGK